jgi:disulfide bond formation protein DsbB
MIVINLEHQEYISNPVKRSDLMKHILPTLLFLSFFLAACGGGAPAATLVPNAPSADYVAGKAAYEKTCVACHGPDAKGVAGLGKDLTTSSFIAEKTDADLKAFILTGRRASDPLNTTGVDMPPKGGNPAMTDEDIENIVAFLRSVHQ